MSRFQSGRLEGLAAYVPGEQPTGMQYIKLNTNESPYPPAPSVIKALTAESLSKLNLYPEPDGTALKQKIADMYGVLSENVMLANGSDETLAFSFLAFCDARRGVAFPDITYGFYPVYVKLFGVDALEIPVRDDFSIDAADYFNLNRNIIIANPNAPTGLTLSLNEIRSIAEHNRDYIVLIDEAYVDFGGESATSLTKEYDNLLVVHTYSKSRSMAGARLSYAIGPEALIADLVKVKYSFHPYNVNRMTQVIGLASLEAQQYYDENCREIAKTRAYTADALKKLGFLMTDSRANFLFARHPEIHGTEFYRLLKNRGILVRNFDKRRTSDYLRITIGTKEQMDALLRETAAILEMRANDEKK